MYKINRDKTVCEGLVFMLWCFVFFFVVSAVRCGVQDWDHGPVDLPFPSPLAALDGIST